MAGPKLVLISLLLCYSVPLIPSSAEADAAAVPAPLIHTLERKLLGFEPVLRGAGQAPDVTAQPASDEESDRRIVGGRKAGDEFPWMVLFGKMGDLNRRCAGVLIHSSWVLTAGHCILTPDRTGFLSATPLGSTMITVGCQDLTSPLCRHVSVQRIVVHPCYVPSTNRDHDDLALLELLDPVNDLPLARLDGVDVSIELLTGMNVTLAGWGKTSNEKDDYGPLDLMRVDVPLGSKEDCIAANPTSFFGDLIDFDKVVCTGGEQGKDSCGGDSGGPAISSTDGESAVIGILSKGSELPEAPAPDCAAAGRYGMYTLTKFYSAYVATTLQGDQYTCKTCPCLDSMDSDPDTTASTASTTAAPGQEPNPAENGVNDKIPWHKNSSLLAGLIAGTGFAFFCSAMLVCAFFCKFGQSDREITLPPITIVQADGSILTNETGGRRVQASSPGAKSRSGTPSVASSRRPSTGSFSGFYRESSPPAGSQGGSRRPSSASLGPVVVRIPSSPKTIVVGGMQGETPKDGIDSGSTSYGRRRHSGIASPGPIDVTNQMTNDIVRTPSGSRRTQSATIRTPATIKKERDRGLPPLPGYMPTPTKGTGENKFLEDQSPHPSATRSRDSASPEPLATRGNRHSRSPSPISIPRSPSLPRSSNFEPWTVAGVDDVIEPNSAKESPSTKVAPIRVKVHRGGSGSAY